MKEDELRSLAQCCICKKKIGQFQLPIFHKITAERFMVNVKAVQRQHGLEQMFNGHIALAQVFSPNQDMAVSMAKGTVMICDDCVIEKLPGVFEAMEEEGVTNDL